MKMVKEPVSSSKQIVGYAEFEQFDTVAEAVEKLGETDVVKLINTQHGTNAKNALRAEATGKPSRKSLEQQAWSRITPEQLQAVAGDGAKIQALLDQTCEVIASEIEAKRKAAQAAINSEAEAEENAPSST